MGTEMEKNNINWILFIFVLKHKYLKMKSQKNYKNNRKNYIEQKK